MNIVFSNIFFWLNIVKGSSKASAVDLLRLSTQKGTETAFLTSKMYDVYPRRFSMGVPQPPGSQGTRADFTLNV